MVVRARATIEEREGGKGERIIITEVPFQVNKARVIEYIAELVRDKKIEGIADLRDESDKRIRVVIDLKRDAIPHIVLNQLYKHTQLQSTFGVIMLALVGGVPRVLGLRDIIHHFVQHRHEVVIRRTTFELRKAKEREHILEGLKIAVDNIDEVIAIIRGSETTAEAGERAADALRAFGAAERRHPEHAAGAAHGAGDRAAGGGAGRGARDHRRPGGHPLQPGAPQGDHQGRAERGRRQVRRRAAHGPAGDDGQPSPSRT